MKFGSVENPDDIDFSLPEDDPHTAEILSDQKQSGNPKVYVGCAKWSRGELKNFYPRGTKDELEYYASQFNAIELNATFYRYNSNQISGWYKKVPKHFRFFPKMTRLVSHQRRLSDVGNIMESFLSSVLNFREKLGTIYLQMPDNFAPKYFDRVKDFIESWPNEYALAVEFRHTDWYNDPSVAEELYQLLEENNVANIIVDTAGRRDLMHMRLTKNEAFIRYVGANHPSDYTRLDVWAERIKTWIDQGLGNIHFFLHQNKEEESPHLGAHFIKKLNKEAGLDLPVPKTLDPKSQ